MKISTKILMLLVGLSVTTASYSQNMGLDMTKSAERARLDKWSIGVNAGLLPFFGDIRKNAGISLASTPHNEKNIGFGANVQRYFVPIFGLRAEVLTGKLSGVKVQDNAWFETKFISYGISGVFNFSNLSFLRNILTRKMTLYALIGAHRISYKPELKYSDSGQPINSASYSNGQTIPLAERGNRITEWSVPYGLGLKYRLGEKWDLGLEGVYISVESDRLDGYMEYNKDPFGYASLSLHYKIGPKRKALEWENPLDLLGNEIDTVRAIMKEYNTDTDDDGVADYFDKDDNTPAGLKVYGDGTAVDTDGDGLTDVKDADPYTTRGAKVDKNGREIDDDGDGVGNSKDLEPGTKAGSLVNFQGKEIKLNEVNNNNSDFTDLVYLPSVYFATGSNNIQYKYYENLAAIARVLKNYPELTLVVIGNADITGNTKSNMKLAERRNKAVVDHMAKVYGIDKSRLAVETKGDTEPLAKGINSINRRVDFKVRQK